MIGTKDVWPKFNKYPEFQRNVTRMRVGPTMYFDEYFGQENDRAATRKITNEIMKMIARLAGDNNYEKERINIIAPSTMDDLTKYQEMVIKS